MAARVCRCFCRFGSIGWSTTAPRTFSACGVMPFLLPSRLPCRYRLLPPLAEPDRTLPWPVFTDVRRRRSGRDWIRRGRHPSDAPSRAAAGKLRPRRATEGPRVPVLTSAFASGLP